MIETNSLVSTDWMANHLEDNNITIVEVNSLGLLCHTL